MILQNECIYKIDQGIDPRLAQFLEIHEAGFNLVPSRSDDLKIPAIQWKWLQDNRQDVQAVHRYFAENKNRNFFVVTGAHPWDDTPGVVVVDADNFDAIGVVTERCPETPLEVVTRNGRHYYYRHPGYRVQQILGVTLDGVKYKLDVKGDGNYVVAPSSYTKDGKLYKASVSITRELVESLPVYDPGWLPHNPLSVPKAVEDDVDDGLEGFEDYGFGWEHEDHEAAVGSHPIPLATRLARCKAYLARCKGTQIGREADNRCFSITMKVVWGFLVPSGDAVKMLAEWGQRDDQLDEAGLKEPWTLGQIEHKVKSVLDKTPMQKPGWMLEASEEERRRDEFFDSLLSSCQGNDGARENIGRAAQAYEYEEPEAAGNELPKSIDDVKPGNDPFAKHLAEMGVKVVAIKASGEGWINYIPERCITDGCEGQGRFYNKEATGRGYSCSLCGKKPWSEALKLLGFQGDGDKPRKKPVLLSVSEARQEAANEVIDPIWGGVQAGMLWIVSGLPNSGKTKIVHTMIARTAAGASELFGLPMKPMKFLSIDPENRLTNTLKWYDRALGDEAVKLDGFLSFVKNESLPDVLEVEYVQDVITGGREIHGDEAKLCVVIDTFRAAYGAEAGYDERSETYVQARLKALKTLANRSGVVILILHHHGWADERTSGSTAWWGVPDAVFSYHRKYDESTGELRRVRVRGNDDTEFQPMKIGRDEKTGLLASLGSVLEIKQEAKDKKAEVASASFLACFPAEGALNYSEIMEAHKSRAGESLGKTAIKAKTASEYKKGFLARSGDGKNGMPYRFQLTTEGSNLVFVNTMNGKIAEPINEVIDEPSEPSGDGFADGSDGFLSP